MKKEIDGVEVTAVDSRGRGRGRTVAGDGTERPVIVTGAYPGDTVDVRLRRRKAGTYLGDIRAVVTAGVPRRAPFCRHFADCGGCTIQDIDYEAQLALKQAMVSAAFLEAGFRVADHEAGAAAAVGSTMTMPPIQPIVSAPRQTRYRNKLEFSFGAQRWLSEEEIADAAAIEDRRGLGFHVSGRFDRVLDLEECHLQPDPSEAIRAFVGDFARVRGFSFYDAREHTGVLRSLTVRTSLTGETMVIVMFGEDDAAAIEAVMSAIAHRFPDLASLNYVVNTSANDSLFPHDVRRWSGSPWITERSGPNLLRVRPKAFAQTNPEQAERLYETALDMVTVREDDRVFDLYCGIGSIALYVARRVATVVGIETIEDAVIAARENAEMNGIGNAVFEAGEVEAILPAVAERSGTPNLVILDPPRAGLHPAARRAVRDLAPERILYISCNPRTQATDIAELSDRYRVTAMRPVDMFPQTRHVENIAVLVRRSID